MLFSQSKIPDGLNDFLGYELIMVMVVVRLRYVDAL